MPISPAELGRRLRAAREQAGLKQDDIARGLGLSRASVSQIEGGDRFPSSLQLSRIAELVGEEINALLDPEGYQPDNSLAAVFRVNEALQADEYRQGAVRRCARLSAEFTNLEDLLRIDRGQLAPVSYELPAPDSRWDAVRQGDELADRERSRLNLGTGPIRDFVELLEAQGVRAFELDLPQGVSGLFLTDRGHGLSAIVAAGEVSERQRFSYAHEFCHLLADRRRGAFVSSRENRDDLLEVRANSFAASFLLPEGGVRATLRGIGKGDAARSMLTAAFDGSDAVAGQKRTSEEAIQIYDVVHLASAFGASYDATLYRPTPFARCSAGPQ
jgi:transcriptional regulator with XRE-family HTH domain